MPQRAPPSSSLMRPFVVLALPGMYLLYKYNQYRQQQMETARRRVTERELLHLNTKIYAKKSKDDCTRALADVPPDVDPVCPDMPCTRKSPKKPGILHRIKLRVVEGGTNFGTPFRRLKKKEDPCTVEVEEPEPKALPPPKKEVQTMPEPRQGVQVSILGADTAVGQYVALLLKQCPCIKKLRLYEAKDTSCSECNRDMYKVVQDLQHIDTNCLVEAFTCHSLQLDQCLQNTDIVLILESGFASIEMPLDKRFYYQAPMIKKYADAISHECPKAFIIVCATPVDCMVPLIAETFKETGWYDPRKLMGSLAVPEMRATTLAARALCLEPRYTRVPCVGGTEGDALVPLFSKAVEFFDFARHNAELMTDAVRMAPLAVSRAEGSCMRAADLSEAHALAKLVNKVSHALLCKDIPRVSGFVETDAGQVVSPARYLAVDVLLNRHGICKQFDFPAHMNDLELDLMDNALSSVTQCVDIATCWAREEFHRELVEGETGCMKFFHYPRHYDRLDDCHKHLIG